MFCRLTLALLIGLLITPQMAAAQSNEAAMDELFEAWSGGDVPGVVVSVVREGEPVFAKGYGMANLTHGIPMSEDTKMNIGSVSKHFTSLAILLLEQDGELGIDDDVRDYLPEMKDFGSRVTLRHMMQHMTGFREIYNLMPIRGWSLTDDIERRMALEIVNRQPELQNFPGGEYNYNNTAYILLADVVEAVADTSFDAFLQERMFDPLDMADTHIQMVQGDVIPGSAQAYFPLEDSTYRQVLTMATYGPSAVYTSANDMTKWLTNFWKYEVGGEEIIKLMAASGMTVPGFTRTGYGMGLLSSTWRGTTHWTHDGGDASYISHMSVFPEIRSGVFISSTNVTIDRALWSQVAELWLADLLEPLPEESEVESNEDVTLPTEEQLNAIAGTYQFQGLGLLIEYTVEDGTLFAQATGQPRFEMSPTSDSTLTFVGVEASVTFHFEEDGSVNRGTHHQGGNIPMVRLETPELTEEDMQAYVGRYLSEELETFWTLSIVDGQLQADHVWYQPFTLEHAQDDAFAGAAWFMGDVRFERNGEGLVTGFNVTSGGRTRDVWFRKVDW